MERIQKILNHPLYQEQFKLLQDAEKDREFCRHTMEHFVDVARLMYIYTLEEKTNVSKELIYRGGPCCMISDAMNRFHLVLHTIFPVRG